MIEYKKHYGLTDEELAAYPTVFDETLLEGQVALVSGAATGIGRGIATLFARLGADLVVCGRNEERLDKAAEYFRGFGRKVVTEVMSIRDTTKSWKLALFLPLITVPQVVLIGAILNQF